MPVIRIEDQLIIPAGLGSLREFESWARSEQFPKAGRLDYVDGRIEVEMSPERLYPHGLVKSAIAQTIMNVSDEIDFGHIFVDRARVVNAAAQLSCEPDVVGVGWDSLQTGKVKYVQAPNAVDAMDLLESDGGPDLVVEIVSPHSIEKDTVRLPEAYFKAGVSEFWLVNALIEPLSFKIYVRGAAGFEVVAKTGEGFCASAVLKREFKLIRNAGRLPNTLVYRLESRHPVG